MIFFQELYSFFFYFLEFLIGVFAIGVLVEKNIVSSAFFLGGFFVGIAGLYMILDAEFLALAQIFIYVGAINVLILFFVMLIDVEDVEMISTNSSVTKDSVLKFVTFFASIAFFAGSAKLIIQNFSLSNFVFDQQHRFLVSDLSEISIHLFKEYLLPFEFLSVLLLVVLIGTVYIAKDQITKSIGQDLESTFSISKKDPYIQSKNFISKG
uniref:NAD(P)H-quinone oxidoreductase subunit 6, chloroplastic n=1 Tax=Prasinococcus sp. CCMP1194 TaxID=110672 RepID=A0A088CI53_9VIRI|nr:subunit 6 of NADH-plastoquinone oxidoreductase [Prasinococcus sp. CCMP1194]